MQQDCQDEVMMTKQHSLDKDDDDTSYSSANFGGAKTTDLHYEESADTIVAAAENKQYFS
jgi:hypothetical protein